MVNINPLAGQVANIVSKFVPDFRRWFLMNLDAPKPEAVVGQFHPEGLTKNLGTNWSRHTTLNRGKSISSWSNGELDSLSFQGRFYQKHAFDKSPKRSMELLEKWIKRDPNLRRPPILHLIVGDFINSPCTLESITGIEYSRPNNLGGIQQVIFTINVREFVPFSLDDSIETDTRYAPAKQGDYYEMLAFHEYGAPELGDTIRKNHPDKQLLLPGEVVTLPSIEGVRGGVQTQTSTSLKTAFGRKDTPQKRLLQRTLESRGKSVPSHILQPSTTPE